MCSCGRQRSPNSHLKRSRIICLIFSNNYSIIVTGGENMLKTHLVLMDELKDYRNPAMKITSMVKNGELTRVVRGLYETDPHTPGYLLAASIYGPSYLSFEYALAHHGLIPEAVHQFTSASFDKKRAKQFETPFGVFSYRDVPESAFPYGILPMVENGYSYRLATPEKALCDQLFIMRPCRSQKQLNALLYEELRNMRPVYTKFNMQPKNCSRDLEAGGTYGALLIPWNVNTVFMAAALGVSSTAFIPYIPLIYLTPIVVIIYAAFKYRLDKIYDDEGYVDVTERLANDPEKQAEVSGL